MTVPDMLGLTGAAAIVTGGGLGIGRASVVRLAEAGCHVAVVDINGETGRSAAKAVEELGRRAEFIEADLLDAAAVRDAVNEARRRLGPLTVAVNVVGGPQPSYKPFLDLSPEDWRASVDLNLSTAVYSMQSEIVAMVSDGIAGRIVNFGSSSGVVGAPNVSAYGAAKAGVIHLTKSVAMEVAQYGIRVNCVVPGTHMTELIRREFEDPATSDVRKEFIRRAGAAPPISRFGEPEETAGVVLFLASDLSSYMTGHALISDGGLLHTTARPTVNMTVEPEALRGLRPPTGSGGAG